MRVRPAAEIVTGGPRAELSRFLSSFPPWDVVLFSVAVVYLIGSALVARLCVEHQPWLCNAHNGGPLMWATLAGVFAFPGYFIVRADFGKPAYDDAHKARAGFERLCTQGPEIVIQ